MTPNDETAALRAENTHLRQRLDHLPEQNAALAERADADREHERSKWPTPD